VSTWSIHERSSGHGECGDVRLVRQQLPAQRGHLGQVDRHPPDVGVADPPVAGLQSFSEGDDRSAGVVGEKRP
jgi:hypothetical protein